MPARLFRDLKPRSEASVRYALEAMEDPALNGLLVGVIRDGKVEWYFHSGPGEVHFDPWRFPQKG